MNKYIDIHKLLSEGERVTLECKKATKGVPSSLWDTYSAFANTYGGTILLGVVEHMDEQDNAKRFEIVGVEDADKIRKDLWNTVNSREKVNINLLCDDDIQTIDIDGKNIIAIRSDAGMDEATFNQYANKLGNKILLEQPINGSISNDWFRVKKQNLVKDKRGYKHSIFPIAQSLVN